MTAAARVVVDIGNTRIKWALLDEAGCLVQRQARDIPPELSASGAEWLGSRDQWTGSGRAEWAFSSVNPPVAEVFREWLPTIEASEGRWYRSAADVPMTMRVLRPTQAGADRALAVLAASSLAASRGDGLVISCGTALTIERIDATGIWEGGAIAAGLEMVSSAMQRRTAQLPRVEVGGEVPAWGGETESAMKAGAFWGTVGALRELIARQGDRSWRIWTGGHASLLAPHVEGRATAPRIVPDLVLRGLAIAAFGAPAESRDG